MNRRNLEANPLLEQFSQYLLKIDDALKRELDLYSWSEFYAPLRYACEGGKRIRPLILVLSAESVMASKGDLLRTDEDVFFAACAIELLHTESVIHDDIIDEENLRRGKPSFHVKYGYNSSILTADFVLGVILSIGSKLNNSRVASELSNAAIKMSEGEIMEIKLAEALKIGEDDYIKVLEQKTASLFEASAKIGAILGGGEEEEIHAMATFGNFLGIAYQIHDDLIDWNNEERLFNILVKKNDQSKEFVDRMEKLYLSYSSKAKKELVKIKDSTQKRHLEHLTDLASVQF
ncbi:MAG: polyprenyl synthetase family protein [Thermoproteota archaeon]|nr:polyprenyl synthetase family protein [Thermoproteota archaeon]MDQ3983902.1 polyprenyl synthetase family protein [Thermoproteota archaeon]